MCSSTPDDCAEKFRVRNFYVILFGASENSDLALSMKIVTFSLGTVIHFLYLSSSHKEVHEDMYAALVVGA